MERKLNNTSNCDQVLGKWWSNEPQVEESRSMMPKKDSACREQKRIVVVCMKDWTSISSDKDSIVMLAVYRVNTIHTESWYDLIWFGWVTKSQCWWVNWQVKLCVDDDQDKCWQKPRWRYGVLIWGSDNHSRMMLQILMMWGEFSHWNTNTMSRSMVNDIGTKSTRAFDVCVVGWNGKRGSKG